MYGNAPFVVPLYMLFRQAGVVVGNAKAAYILLDKIIYFLFFPASFEYS